MEASPQAIVTPFGSDSRSYEVIPQDSINSTGTEQRPLISVEDPAGDMVTLHHLSSGSTSPAAVSSSRPAAPAPAGLSGKEMARWRAALSSQPQSESHNRSTLDMSQPTSSLANNVSESGERPSPYDSRRLHSEVKSLRREMERLRAEGVIIEAPPSYPEGDR